MRDHSRSGRLSVETGENTRVEEYLAARGEEKWDRFVAAVCVDVDVAEVGERKSGEGLGDERDGSE